jgi:diketogulonate reductase-like aldo/keto reductase
MDRRFFAFGLAGATLATALRAPSRAARPPSVPLVQRTIPRTGERLPVLGMGTWITFDVGADPMLRAPRRDVLREFLARGGRTIDTSPMYGHAEEVVGDLLVELGRPPVFSAGKVWTNGRMLAERGLYRSLEAWRLRGFDLLQVHNLLDWQTHLPLLREWQEAGRIRYVGVTTSHGRRHDELEAILARERLDFVQFTYNLGDRSVERRLLPLAAERGVAVIANRPLDGGALFDRVRGKPLPPWAGECGCGSWAELFLKFVVSHPAVTCAIPATSQPSHMAENMGAAVGPMPEPAQRRRIAAWFDGLPR